MWISDVIYWMYFFCFVTKVYTPYKHKYHIQILSHSNAFKVSYECDPRVIAFLRNFCLFFFTHNWDFHDSKFLLCGFKMANVVWKGDCLFEIHIKLLFEVLLNQSWCSLEDVLMYKNVWSSLWITDWSPFEVVFVWFWRNLEVVLDLK